MKSIFGYFKMHFKGGINVTLYIYTAIFLAIAIFLNYYYRFEDTVLNSFYSKPIGLLVYTAFYGFAYYMIAIPTLFLQKKVHLLKDKTFWIKSLVFLGLLGVMGAFYYYTYILDYAEAGYERYFLRKILVNAKRILPYLLVLYIMQRIYDKETKGIYGLRFSEVHLKPYFIMLLLVLPLICWASFQEDFLSTYPKLKYWQFGDNVFGMSKPLQGTVFEIFYGLDFVSVELLFRGALIIGMAKVLGKDAILPMVATYAFLHFGKPLGETVSSIFGGYILGVIALYSRNIMGGVVVHIGIAYLMELTALLQHLLGGRH